MEGDAACPGSISPPFADYHRTTEVTRPALSAHRLSPSNPVGSDFYLSNIHANEIQRRKDRPERIRPILWIIVQFSVWDSENRPA